MKCNIGNTDRMLRIVAGVAIVGAGVVLHSWWGAVGLVPLLTAVIRFCPAYTIIGLSTDK